MDAKKNVATAESESQYLTFKVKDQFFGLSIQFIKEIIEYGNVTPIPLMPDFIKGVLNLRGNVVPLIDISRRFQWEKTQIQRMTCIIITEVPYDDHNLEIGLVVDSVDEVVNLSVENYEKTPHFGANVRVDFLQGIGKIDDQFVLMIDVAKIVDLEEFSELRKLIEANNEDEMNSAKNLAQNK